MSEGAVTTKIHLLSSVAQAEGLSEYITDDRKADGVTTHNTFPEPKLAARHIEIEAAKAYKNSKGVLHMINSWNPELRPSYGQMLEFARRVLGKVRMDVRPRISAMHVDRDHLHMHTAVSRVDEDGRVIARKHLVQQFREATIDVCIEMGLEPPELKIRPTPGRMADAKAWNGRVPAGDWLYAKLSDHWPTDWQELEAIIAPRGIRIAEPYPGGFRFELDIDGRTIGIKFSTVGLGPAARASWGARPLDLPRYDVDPELTYSAYYARDESLTDFVKNHPNYQAYLEARRRGDRTGRPGYFVRRGPEPMAKQYTQEEKDRIIEEALGRMEDEDDGVPFLEHADPLAAVLARAESLIPEGLAFMPLLGTVGDTHTYELLGTTEDGSVALLHYNGVEGQKLLAVSPLDDASRAYLLNPTMRDGYPRPFVNVTKNHDLDRFEALTGDSDWFVVHDVSNRVNEELTRLRASRTATPTLERNAVGPELAFENSIGPDPSTAKSGGPRENGAPTIEAPTSGTSSGTPAQRIVNSWLDHLTHRYGIGPDRRTVLSKETQTILQQRQAVQMYALQMEAGGNEDPAALLNALRRHVATVRRADIADALVSTYTGHPMPSVDTFAFQHPELTGVDVIEAGRALTRPPQILDLSPRLRPELLSLASRYDAENDIFKLNLGNEAEEITQGKDGRYYLPSRSADKENEALVDAALLVAAARYDNRVHLQGSREFLNQAMARAARLGIVVTNRELQQEFAQHVQEAREEQRALLAQREPQRDPGLMREAAAARTGLSAQIKPGTPYRVIDAFPWNDRQYMIVQAGPGEPQLLADIPRDELDQNIGIGRFDVVRFNDRDGGLHLDNHAPDAKRMEKKREEQTRERTHERDGQSR